MVIGRVLWWSDVGRVSSDSVEYGECGVVDWSMMR